MRAPTNEPISGVTECLPITSWRGVARILTAAAAATGADVAADAGVAAAAGADVAADAGVAAATGPGVADRGAALPRWAGPAFRQITGILADELFPCLFARRVNHLQSGWFAFIDSVETDAGCEAARRAVLAYYRVLERSPRGRALFMPLLVVVRPRYPMLSLPEYRAQAWGLFQYLHDHDPEPWPAGVPTDPDRGDWSFCFGGRQLFSNVSAPAHRVHRSRNLGDSLVFAMQPRTNFDQVGGNNPRGRAVRAEIRRRAERYEDRPAASHLGFYGTAENREWIQMTPMDTEDDPDFPRTCPLRFNARRPAREP